MSDGPAEMHFLPGNHFRVVRDDWRRPARPVHRRVRVRSPGRLHFQVIDFGRMQPMIPGGGGIGISTTTGTTELEITVGAGSGAPVPTAAHLLALYCHLVGHDAGDVRVEVPARIRHVHSGYGSNVTFNTALLAGLNAAFGTPFSVPELWDILTQNFVENTADGERIYFGLDTGVGEACVLYGGIVWVDEHARFVGNAQAHLWVVTATGDPAKIADRRLPQVGHATEIGIGEAEEQDVLINECLAYQREWGDRLLHFLEHRMKPRLLADDWRGLLALGWEMNAVGNHRVQELVWRADVLKGAADTVREAGGLYCTMSSAGPSIFGLAETEETALGIRDALQARFGDLYSDFQVGRAGEKLRIFVEE